MFNFDSRIRFVGVILGMRFTLELLWMCRVGKELLERL